MSAQRSTVSVRAYATTPWSRALVDVAEGRFHGDGTGSAVDSRKITTARRYFRDRHVHRLAVSSGSVSSSVDGSQLEPFAVVMEFRTVDSATVAALLRAGDSIAEVMSLARGEQPRGLGDLLLPTESADIVGACSCPDDSGRCIHILSTVYEVAAEIDRSPTTLLAVMGTSLPELLNAISRLTDSTAAENSARAPRRDHSSPTALTPAVDFYGRGAAPPPTPSPPRMNPITELDVGALRGALRACGVAAGDVAEAVDELADLYDRITEPHTSPATL